MYCPQCGSDRYMVDEINLEKSCPDCSYPDNYIKVKIEDAGSIKPRINPLSDDDLIEN